MRILPTGVPLGLSRLKHRLAAAIANTPLFFIGAVIAIAVVFRVGIGAVKPAVAAEEEAPPRPSHVAVATATATATVAPTPAVEREPDPTVAAPKPMLRHRDEAAPPRRKSRTHGKR